MEINEKIYDAETHKETIVAREASESEKKAIEKSRFLMSEKLALKNEMQAAKAALLEKLGITEEEAKLLLS